MDTRRVGAPPELESRLPDAPGENGEADGALADPMSSRARASDRPSGRPPRRPGPVTRASGARPHGGRLGRRLALGLALLGSGLAFGWWADGYFTRMSRRSAQVPALAPRRPRSLERLPPAPPLPRRPSRRAEAGVEVDPTPAAAPAPAAAEPPERRSLRAIVSGEGPAGRVEVGRLLRRPVGQAALGCLRRRADEDPEALAYAELMLASVDRVSFRRDVRVVEGEVTHPALLERFYGGSTTLRPAGRESWVVTQPGPTPDGAHRPSPPAGIVGDALLVEGDFGFDAESWVEAFEDAPPDAGPLAALEGPSDIALLIGADELETVRRGVSPWIQRILERVERVELRVDATDDVRVEIDLHTPHPKTAAAAFGAALLAARAAGAFGPPMPAELAELLSHSEMDALDGIARLTTTLSADEVVELVPECRASRRRAP